ncbi:MAG: anhydro-N-acetylmuramic acid kinase [Bacteroidales bacterium]|nr:anhydro-N-acetylmuramic acid kinase [Bacteroidales bacterium]
MKKTYRVTGLMSGSSMDGVDLACCDLIWKDGLWDFRILEAETFPYPEELYCKLEQACKWSKKNIDELDLELGHHYARLLSVFHRKTGLFPQYISSHGHTILHEPKRGITFQAGNGRIMADQTGIPVINDFRSEDVAQGGQGAPLVPLGDSLLFHEYEGCLNLGGFANISFENSRGERIAYDLCPANMALNHIAAMEGLPFDRDGEMARSGQVHKELLEKLNGLDFYSKSGPRSLGREWFLEQFLPFIRPGNLAAKDIMATVLEHIAYQISRNIHEAGIKSLLITGGGTLNLMLLERLKKLTGTSLVIPEEKLIHYKEALIFALLGVLRIRGEINCLASVSGGRKDLSAGTIYNI